MATIFGNSISEESISFYRIGTTSIIPRSPINLSATTVSSSQIQFTWSTLGTEASGGWSANQIFYSTDNVNFSYYGIVYSPNSYAQVTGLSASTTYYFKVRTAISIGGVDYFSELSPTTASATTAGVYVAYGGPVSNYTYNGYKYSFIVTSGNFTVQSLPNCMVIVVGGGGGGGAGQSNYGGGGGGGGGVLKTTLNITAGSASAVIGQGGAGQQYPSVSAGNNGGTTTLNLPGVGMTAGGGGGGGSYYNMGANGNSFPNAGCTTMGGVGGGGGGLAYGGGGVYYTANNATCSQSNSNVNYGGARGFFASSGFFGGGGGGAASYINSPTPGAFYVYSVNIPNGGYPYMCADTGLIFSSGGGGGKALDYSSYGNGLSGSVNYGASSGISGYASMNGNGGTGYGQQYYAYPAGAGGNATLISSPHNVSVGVNALNHNYGSGGGGGAWYGGRGGTGSQGVIIFRHL